MLKAGAGARPPRPGSKTRLLGVGAALAILIVAATVVVLRDDPGDAPGSTGAAEEKAAPSSARSGTVTAPGERAAPRPPRVGREKSVLRPRAGARPTAAPADEAPPLAPDDVSDPALKAVLAARDDRSPAGTRVLIDNLGSRDDVVVAEATKALAARDATEAIAPLARIELETAAGSGLSVIDALGKLGGAAVGDDKAAAVDRLLEMLREEKQRAAPESPGNLIQIYEALGETLDPRAVPALEAELLDASVPRAPKVVIVQALVDIGLASSKDALAEALRVHASAQDPDSFEEEIRQELVATIEEALEVL